MSLYNQIAAQHYSLLPAGWEIRKIKFIADVQTSNVDKISNADEEPVKLCNYVDVYYNDVIVSDLPFMEATATDKEIEKFTLKGGQVLITKDSEGWDDIGISALVGEDMPGVLCGYHLAIFSPEAEKLDGGFLAWLCRADALNDQFKLSANGVTRFGLGQYAMKNAAVAIPPLQTQKRITAFLDEKTTQIDALIAKKQTLLERLAEKRQAIITQAVTKGLHSAAPMKKSGVDWVGQIPAHWEITRLRYLTDAPLKYGANAPAEWEDPNWPRFIRITDVDQSGSLRANTFRSLPPEVAEPYLLSEGDILLARSGATVGKSFIYRKDWGKACFAGYLILARISKYYSANFVYQFLNSDAFWSWVSASFIQSTIQNISAEKYANLWVPCPPKDEQLEITDTILSLSNQISYHERKVEESLKALGEYRAALIAAAVTGQIDGLK